MRPILLPASSVNQTLPSGPAAMSWGLLSSVGMRYSVMSSAGAAAAGEPSRAATTATMTATTTEAFDEMRVSMVPPKLWSRCKFRVRLQHGLRAANESGDRQNRSDAAFSASVSAESGGRQY